MNNLDLEKFLSDLVKPLVVFPEEVVVKIFSEDENGVVIQVMVNDEDKGRVIGKNGRIINAIKTVCFAVAARHGKKVDIIVDAF